jgi:hypothetical protein
MRYRKRAPTAALDGQKSDNYSGQGLQFTNQRQFQRGEEERAEDAEDAENEKNEKNEKLKTVSEIELNFSDSTPRRPRAPAFSALETLLLAE